jgi:hypothetical protein
MGSEDVCTLHTYWCHVTPIGVTPIGVTPIGVTPIGVTPIGVSPSHPTPIGVSLVDCMHASHHISRTIFSNQTKVGAHSHAHAETCLYTLSKASTVFNMNVHSYTLAVHVGDQMDLERPTFLGMIAQESLQQRCATILSDMYAYAQIFMYTFTHTHTHTHTQANTMHICVHPSMNVRCRRSHNEAAAGRKLEALRIRCFHERKDACYHLSMRKLKEGRMLEQASMSSSIHSRIAP